VGEQAENSKDKSRKIPMCLRGDMAMILPKEQIKK
jgi:hypothetical protein